MEYITLNNGVKMPALGYGVYQIDKDICEQCVLDALKSGYRLIDTAQSYRNEEAVGRAIEKSGCPREELFITTKVWIDNYGFEKTYQSVLDSMVKLKVDYLDLILLHQPFSDYYAAYRALEKLYAEGKVRAIGVSNFYPDRLSDISIFNEIKPQVNQVEVNVFNQQLLAQENMIKNTVQIEAWAPFGEGKKDMFNQSELKKIADSHGKSVAQVILRWLLQREVVVVVKTVREERMAENFNVFDFVLTSDDMKVIAALDTETSLFFNHQDPAVVDMFAQFVMDRRD